MGYYKRSGTDITDFWPDDTDTKIHIESDLGTTISDIIEKAKEKWGPDISLDDIRIEAEHIHTHCIYYDRYDSSDYTNFIVIELINQ